MGPSDGIAVCAVWKDFRMGMCTYIWANVCYMGLASMLFVILTRGNVKRIIKLIICELLLGIKILYSLTAMAESIRYAMGILAVALLYYLFIHKNSVRWYIKYILIPIYLLYITQAYLIFGIFIFGYMLIVLREKKMTVSIFASVVVSGITILVSWWILKFFSAPYIAGEKQTFLQTIVGNIKEIFFTMKNPDKFMFTGYYFMYLMILVAVLCMLVFHYGQLSINDKWLHIGAMIMLLTFLGGYVVLYNTTSWTFTRGLNVGWVCCLYMLCLVEKESIIKIAAICSLVVMLIFYSTIPLFTDDRFITAEWEDDMEQLREEIKAVVIVDEDTGNPWDNTVALYNTNGLYLELALPDGVGINAMYGSYINYDAKYAIVGKLVDATYAMDKKKALEMAGFSSVIDNENMTVLVRKN